MAEEPPPQPPVYLHSYRSPSPINPLQNFGDQGQAPYGYIVGETPKIFQPHVNIPGGPPPVYHIKVTATPVSLPPGVEAPEYVVAADPVVAGFPAVATTRDGTVITHASPEETAANPGFTIKPLHFGHTEHISGEAKPFAVASAADRDAQAFVHLYAGAGATDTRQMVSKTTSQAGAPGHAGMPPGTQPLEAGYSRPLRRPAGDLLGDETEKIYNWIIPTDAGEIAGAQQETEASEKVSDKAADTTAKPGLFGSLFGKIMGRKEVAAIGQQESTEKDLGDIFARASMDMRAAAALKEEEDTVGKGTHIVSTATDEELGLPSILRPSVRYGGVEFAPPEFAGSKGPLNYKLHAIEVHQYIPLPAVDEPWFSRNHLNPSTNAIFGPMPLPFDPAHSGMVAPTFQRTIHNHPAPVLSPELARMFNHELPVISHICES